GGRWIKTEPCISPHELPDPPPHLLRGGGAGPAARLWSRHPGRDVAPHHGRIRAPGLGTRGCDSRRYRPRERPHRFAPGGAQGLARGPGRGGAQAHPRDCTRSNCGKLDVGPPLTLPYIDATDGPGRVEQARSEITRSAALLTALQHNVNLWFGAAVLVAALAALLLAGWLSTRISTPVEARIAIGHL